MNAAAATRSAPRYGFPPRAMRAQAAAYYLGISESQLRTLIARGELHAGHRWGRGVVFWLRDELDGLLDRITGGEAGPAGGARAFVERLERADAADRGADR